MHLFSNYETPTIEHSSAKYTCPYNHNQPHDMEFESYPSCHPNIKQKNLEQIYFDDNNIYLHQMLSDGFSS